MRNKLSTILFALIIFTVAGKAQWMNEGAWPDTSFKGQLHGIAVDPDGKVWLGDFNSYNYVLPGTSDTVATRLIQVFNSDGSPASFSPIWSATVSGTTDTLNASIRGMATDHNGNIIMVDGLQRMYRFNYQTGEAMNKVVLALGTSPIAPGVAANGDIYVGPVVNASSHIEIYDADFNLIDPAAVSFTASGFSRAMEVSADGHTIYFPVYTTDSILIYNRPDEFSAFDLVGAIAGPACESIVWNDATGHLWFSGGSFNDQPDPASGFTENTWYGYDVTTSTVVDSLKWEFVIPNDPGERPRAIAFSPNGGIAYIGCFGTSGLPLSQKVVNPDVGVRPDPNTVVEGYDLLQNYPNPFNPTTQIKFTVAKEGFVTLKVYDILGKEVANLVSEQMPAGAYTADFNASNLATGTYIYTLSVNGVSISKKMMFLK